jgi:enoyl-CoA hydratase
MGKITFDLEGVVGRIRIDDGGANVIEREFVNGLRDALDCAEKERARAVVLEGRPGMFCAGLDLKFLPKLDGTGRRAFARDLSRLLLRLFQFHRPVVAAITGDALGGGALLALSCDVRLAAAGDYGIGIRAVSVELDLPTFAVEMAKAQLAPQAQTHLIVFGEVVPPGRALELGLVDRVVPPDQLVRGALIEANRLSVLPDPTYGLTKRRLRAPAVAASMAREEMDLDALFQDGFPVE